MRTNALGCIFFVFSILFLTPDCTDIRKFSRVAKKMFKKYPRHLPDLKRISDQPLTTTHCYWDTIAFWALDEQSYVVNTKNYPLLRGEVRQRELEMGKLLKGLDQNIKQQELEKGKELSQRLKEKKFCALLKKYKIPDEDIKPVFLKNHEYLIQYQVDSNRDPRCIIKGCFYMRHVKKLAD